MLGSRIKQARLMRGFTLASLADRIGITAQAVGKYEKELATPRTETLMRLAHALDVTPEFLLRAPSPVEIQPVFRKQRKTSAKQDKALVMWIKDWLERYLQLENALSLDVCSNALPDGFPKKVASSDDIEEAATVLREEWKLGEDPIANLISILEDRSFLMGEIANGSGFEACTFEISSDGDRRAIAIRKNIPGDRQRLSIAHEIGHLALTVGPELDEEKAAFRFAAAFLVPKDVALRELRHRRSTLGDLTLLSLKHEYGMSMQAWIHRACDLEVISPSKYMDLNIEFGRRGWRRQEPGPQIESEHPRRFDHLVLWGVEENLITRSRASELLNEPFEAFLSRQRMQVGESF